MVLCLANLVIVLVPSIVCCVGLLHLELILHGVVDSRYSRVRVRLQYIVLLGRYDIGRVPHFRQVDMVQYFISSSTVVWSQLYVISIICPGSHLDVTRLRCSLRKSYVRLSTDCRDWNRWY